MRSFRPLSSRTARWRRLGQEGLEHLTLVADAAGFVARGVVIGEGGGVGYGVAYTLACDAQGRARRLELTSADGRALRLSSDGEGRWRNGEDAPLPAFDGCVDLDLSGTPLTNTLPIRRLPLRAGAVLEIDALYVPFADFVPVRDQQRYTCLEPARRYRYEAVDGAFAAEIEVDAEGLVLTYPPLFARADEPKVLP